MKLIQKQGLKRREFDLIEKDKCIAVLDKSNTGTKKWTVQLENLGHQKIIEESSKLAVWITGGCFLSFAIFFTAVNLADKDKSLDLWAWISIGSFFALWGIIILATPNKRELHLNGGMESLTFFLDSPSKKEVNDFVETVIEQSKNVLLEKYAKIDPDLPEETMINQLN